MDTKDSNIKSHPTGGLKLMTVFIAVLALHVLVIGGITVYHLMSGGGSDADLTTTDKTHKSTMATDGSMPDVGQSDKTAAPAVATPAEVATIPANPPAPAPTTPAPTETITPAPAPAPVLTPTPAPAVAMPAPLISKPPTQVADQEAPSGPISAELAPPPEPAPAPAPMVSGPVHMPPAVTPAPVSQQTYTVKITDSYKKIAHAHHITVAQLKEANHIKGDVLHTGQKLIIPSTKTYVAGTPSAPSTLDASSSGPMLSDSTTASSATLTTLTTSTVSYSHVYTVVKGDTLTKIAHRFKTTTTALMNENSITDPTKLAIGKKLKIPSRESRSARNGAPSSTQPGQVQAKENAPSGQLANFVP